MTRRRVRAALLALAAGASALAAWSFPDRSAAHPVERLLLCETLRGDGVGVGRTAVVTVPAAVDELLGLVAAAEPAPPIKCGNSLPSPRPLPAGGLRLFLLPADDEGSYDVIGVGPRRVRIDRPTFLDAMQRAGVDWLPTE